MIFYIMIKYITVLTFGRFRLSFTEVAISLEENTSVLTCFSGGKLPRYMRLLKASNILRQYFLA